MIRLTPFFNRYISLGNGYTHTHSNPGFRGSIMGMYKNWSMMIEMNTSYHTLWGETLQKEEKLHSIAVGYNTEKWGVQMMLIREFGIRKNKKKTWKKLVISPVFCIFIVENQNITKSTGDDYQRQSYRDFLYYR